MKNCPQKGIEKEATTIIIPDNQAMIKNLFPRILIFQRGLVKDLREKAKNKESTERATKTIVLISSNGKSSFIKMKYNNVIIEPVAKPTNIIIF